ncbi:MAG: dTMP kinase [Kordiimonas sp.]
MKQVIVNPARFITLEGGEGAGKSTQIQLLNDWLQGQGITTCLTREPGGSPEAEQIRDLVLKGATDRWTGMTEALLMTASRAEHVEKKVKPALAENKWVLCDRFFDSSIAYQGAGRGLGMERVKQLQTLALGDFKPDLTIILDLPVEIGLSRAIARESAKSDMEDRFERMDTSFHETLRNAFLSIAEENSERCVVINADSTPEYLQGEIRKVVLDKFGQTNG